MHTRSPAPSRVNSSAARVLQHALFDQVAHVLGTRKAVLWQVNHNVPRPLFLRRRIRLRNHVALDVQAEQAPAWHLLGYVSRQRTQTWGVHANILVNNLASRTPVGNESYRGDCTHQYTSRVMASKVVSAFSAPA